MVENWMFDLDGTLLYVREIFKKTTSQAKLHLRERGVREEELGVDFDNFLAQAHDIVNVNPDRLWPFVLDKLAEKYKFDEQLAKQAIGILMQAYIMIPTVFPDAFEALGHLKATGADLWLVSHSSPGWLDHKLHSTGLDHFFERGKNAYATSVDRPKDDEAWRGAFEYFNVDPSGATVVGDGIKQDIWPAYRIGVSKIYWISRAEENWEVFGRFSEGSLPPKVRRVANLTEIISGDVGDV